ncbi:c-type cytochrome [Tuwongella immobilis]|uniref:Cytochrome c domain-containing protein n=1 Tax=Tuwongella immobilis TaxID=692036 RepID=A0A6C2YNV0_9BACT|nr:cytochrome c [Tuwongella immobilis]VIP03300.1 cytochrome c class i : C-type cytochrome OS=uncultured planctomycete GN=HGMM_F22C11C34 PE=4 SV=1: Cytochrome_CBB3 [Tuwongella immobilis]VTS03971.1 cytochrome c class i : C-type cytochrome OS=uncultured planctomycete GN=HGMM_F22C11C34 PE=4 SV=1: Cytochrome_CBB3 [Tuwongella immobilis]
MKINRRGIVLITGLSLMMVLGCSTQKADPTQAVDRYPVREDWLVADSIGISPSKYYLPGYPPLLRLSKDSTDAEIQALWGEVTANRIRDTRIVAGDERAEFGKVLDSLFGTPSTPKIEPISTEVKAAIDHLQLDPQTLAVGSLAYNRYCMTCHGTTGNGNGPGGRWLVPGPRDYREGIFKFISTDSYAAVNGDSRNLVGHKPRRADLRRTIVHGMDGAPMPSFAGLSDTELESVISYVIHLSIRGEVEYEVMKLAADPRGNDYDVAADLKAALKAIAPRWMVADQSPVVTDTYLGQLLVAEQKVKGYESQAQIVPADQKPAVEAQLKSAQEELKALKASRADRGLESLAQEYREMFPSDKSEASQEKLLNSIARGYEIFLNEKQGGCNACHIQWGINGAYKYDRWGTVVRARNLTTATYRGGRKPEYLYTRIYNGIYGSGMQSFHPLLKQTEEDRLKGESKMWDVINFVMALNDPVKLKMLDEKKGKKLD